MTKPIYVLCLHNVRTGGPEAIHQLSDALIEQGFDATITYYTWEEIAALERAEPQDGYAFGIRKNTIAEYHRYRAMVCNIVKNDPNSIVVLPETLCHLAPKFNKATVLIWWLSVDNAFGGGDARDEHGNAIAGSLSKINLIHLREVNVLHATQSQYADDFLLALGIVAEGFLTDYTVDLSQYATPQPMNERARIVAYNANPHKVTANIPALIDATRAIDPSITFLMARGSRENIADLFSRARVFVDLGCFPGKDRMPREAASMGCRPLLLDTGAAARDMEEWATLYLDNHLAKRIVAEINQCAHFDWAEECARERATFFKEVRELFGGLC